MELFLKFKGLNTDDCLKSNFFISKKKEFFLFFSKKIHKKQLYFTTADENIRSKNQTVIDFLSEKARH